MKYRVYNFLDSKVDSKIDNKYQRLEKSTAFANFEVQQTQDISIEELLKKNYDLIEFTGDQYEKFLPFIGSVDWKTNQLFTADSLILKNKSYRPHNVLAETLMLLLRKNVSRVNSLSPVIIVGDYHFVISVAAKLAMSGFIEIVVSFTEPGDPALKGFETKIKSMVFNLNLVTIPIGELTAINRTGSLLISCFVKEKNKDAYDLMAYFNFLSEGATFIDCNSISDTYLVEDARKADIFVIDEVEVLEYKYDYLAELLKN